MIKNKSFGGVEILHIVETIALDKGISKESILEALEDALVMAAKTKYGTNSTIRAVINRNSGDIELCREILVVADDHEADEDDRSTKIISLTEATEAYPNSKVGNIIKEILPPLEMGRLNAIYVKQIIVNKVRELERAKICEEFKDRVGEILNGVVEKIEIGGFIVKLSNGEAILKRDQALKADRYELGDRIRAYLLKVDEESKEQVLILSRTHKNFVAQLFRQEVPEIYEGIVEIKDIARDPGSRTKISVYSSNPHVHPVGTCVGIRGSKVQAISKELREEKIDIVKWSEDPATYLVNALGDIHASKVVIDENQNKIDVVVLDEKQSQAIGRKGQNIKLISELIGWKINIVTEELESNKRQEAFNNTTKLFMDSLNLEELLAQIIASGGYSSIESLAEAEINSISSIEGLDEEIAKEIISRAKEYLSEKEEDT